MPRSADIVLPCYNPNARWHLELLKFDEFIRDHFTIHYIIVNDGSTEGNVSDQIDALRKNNISLDFISYTQNKGKGFALRRGVTVAMNEHVVYTDIDFPFTNESMLNLLETITSGSCDVAAGFRDNRYYANKMTVFRRSLSLSFRFFMKHLLRMPVSDTQCGLKAFNRAGRQKFLNTRTNRYLFDFEFIYSSSKDRNITIKTVEAQLKTNVSFSRMRFTILFREFFNLIVILLSPRK